MYLYMFCFAWAKIHNWKAGICECFAISCFKNYNSMNQLITAALNMFTVILKEFSLISQTMVSCSEPFSHVLTVVWSKEKKFVQISW